MSPAYGVSLKEWAAQLSELPVDFRDWSMDLAEALGYAYQALNRLEDAGVDLSYNRRKLVYSALESAWREMLYLRHRRLPAGMAEVDVPRPIRLTKTGKIYAGHQTTDNTIRRYYGDTYCKAVRRHRDAPASNAKRVRSRRDRKPDRPADAGDCS